MKVVEKTRRNYEGYVSKLKFFTLLLKEAFNYNNNIIMEIYRSPVVPMLPFLPKAYCIYLPMTSIVMPITLYYSYNFLSRISS